jgi:nicotinamidase-related amidase
VVAALVVCDVWDTHWCATARRQADELAPGIDALARAVRRRGGAVIHAPSQTEPFYEGTPPYERAVALTAPAAAVRGRPEIPVPAHPRCPCTPPCEPPDAGAAEWPWPWRHQHPGIEVADEDFVVCEDGDAVVGIARAMGSSPVAICGLHLDQCVLDRPFGAKALWAAGLDVVVLDGLCATSHPDDHATVVAAIRSVLRVGTPDELLGS